MHSLVGGWVDVLDKLPDKPLDVAAIPEGQVHRAAPKQQIVGFVANGKVDTLDVGPSCVWLQLCTYYRLLMMYLKLG